MEELHQQAGMIAQSHFQQLQRKVTERYREFYGNNQELASDDMKEVVKAAYYPRIDSLFVAIGHQQWSSFDPQNSKVRLHEQEQAGDENLLDFTAIHTLLKDGSVFVVETEQVPAKSAVAAISRY